MGLECYPEALPPTQSNITLNTSTNRAKTHMTKLSVLGSGAGKLRGGVLCDFTLSTEWPWLLATIL
eukprot:6244349-Amphidinium_carterae.1